MLMRPPRSLARRARARAAPTAASATSGPIGRSRSSGSKPVASARSGASTPSCGAPFMRSARSAATHSSARIVRRCRTAWRAWPAACQAKLACSSSPREIATVPSTAGTASARSRASASAARYSAIRMPELPGASTERNGDSPLSDGSIRCARRAADMLANGTSASRSASRPSAHRRRVEAAVVQRLVGGDQRVLGRRVDLDREHVVERRRRRRAAPRRPAAGSAGRTGPASAPARARPPVSARSRVGDGDQAGQRARGGDGAGERLAVAVERVERQRRDAEPGVEQLAHVGPGERGRGVGGGVGAHQRERVAGLDLDAAACAAAAAWRPLALAGERQAELREQREVAGADPAEVAQHRQRAVAQDRGERVGDLRPVAAAAGGHLREPDSSVARTTSSGSASPTPPAWLRSSRTLCARRSASFTTTSRLAPTPVVRP